MINVYKSDTGQYVLIHRPSQTVVIDASLDPGFEKIHGIVKDQHPEFAQEIMAPFDSTGKGEGKNEGGLARVALVLLASALPFLWLLALHFTLTSALADARIHIGDTTLQHATQKLEESVQDLRLQVNDIAKTVTSK